MTTRKSSRKQKIVDWFPRLAPLYFSGDLARPGVVTLHDHIAKEGVITLHDHRGGHHIAKEGVIRLHDHIAKEGVIRLHDHIAKEGVITLHDHIGLAKLTMKNAIRYLSGRKAGCRRRGHKGQDQDLSVSPNVHVPMDFTGAVGKIVEDPKEVEAIEEDSPYPVLKRNLNSWRGKQSGLDWRIDFVQPWFQGAMGRDQANTVLLKYGQVDGTFIVRFSRRIEGAFVLSYVHSKKVYHTQILPFLNPDNVVSYSLDQGATKFFDLTQLVDFYTLNQGVLVSNLTYFLEPEDLLDEEDMNLLHPKHEDEDSHDSTDCQADLYFDQSEMLEFHQSEAEDFNQSESRNFNQSESAGDLDRGGDGFPQFPHIFKQKSQYSLEESKSRLKHENESGIDVPTADQDSGYLEAFNQGLDEECQIDKSS